MKAGREFAKRLDRKTNKKNLVLHARIAFLIIVLISVIIGLILCAVMSIKAEPDNLSSVSDLGLDATNGVYVADKANVLNDNVKQKVYNLNKKLEKSDYHAQIMVVVVPSIPSKYSTINDYSMAIAEKYKPGNKKQDTGLLYTVAINDRKARLEVGYGLEGKIPDAIAAKLQQPANAHYKNQEYSAGVSALLDGVQQLLLDGKPIDKISITPSRETDKNPEIDNSVIGFWVFLLLVIGGIVIIHLEEDYSCNFRTEDSSRLAARDQEDSGETENDADMDLSSESYSDSSSSSNNDNEDDSDSSSSSNNDDDDDDNDDVVSSLLASSSLLSSSFNSDSSLSSFSFGDSIGGGSFGGGGATTSW